MASHGAHEIFTEGLRHQELGWVLRRVGDTRVDNPVWLTGSFAAVRPMQGTNGSGHGREHVPER